MGFRNPVTTAVDQVARDAAAAAATSIIPGSRLAADAIDGKTITGSTIRTASTGQRVQIDSTSGLVGYNAAGAAVTSVDTTGKLTSTNASVSGSFSALSAGGVGVILDQHIAGAASGGGLLWKSGLTGGSDGTARDDVLTSNGTPIGRSLLLDAGSIPGYAGTSATVTAQTTSSGSTIQLSADTITLAGLPNVPLGLVQHGITTATVGSITATAVEISSVRLSCRLRPGRAYRPDTLLRVQSTIAGDVAAAVVRITRGAAATPSNTDPGVSAMTTTCSTANANYPLAPSRRFQVTNDDTYEISMWVSRLSGTGTVTVNTTALGDLSLAIDDTGPALANIPMITL